MLFLSGLTPALLEMIVHARRKSMKYVKRNWESLHVFVAPDTEEKITDTSAKVSSSIQKLYRCF